MLSFVAGSCERSVATSSESSSDEAATGDSSSTATADETVSAGSGIGVEMFVESAATDAAPSFKVLSNASFGIEVSRGSITVV